MCVYRAYTHTSLHAMKIYKEYLHIFAISIQQIIPINYLSEKKFNFFFKKLARKESKVDLIQSKGHYFPECSRLFPSPYCLYQKVPGSSDFLFKTFSFTSLSHSSKIPQEYDCLFKEDVLWE